MGTLRAPRAVISVNGTSVPCKEIEVSLSRTQDCDTLHAVVPFGALPSGMDENWWSTANDVTVQALFSNDGEPTTKLFEGKVDNVDHDFTSRLLTISARDKVAGLLDKKHIEKHQNKQPTEVVQELAGQHGLSVDADAMTDKAGKIYQIDYAAVGLHTSQWSFIQHLAAKHGMDAYATGGKVYFKSPDEKLPVFKMTYVPPTAASYAQGTFMTLRASRRLQLGRPCKCKVQSWNHKQKRAYEYEAVEEGVGEPLEYQHNEPGVTQDQVTKIAKKQLGDVTKHEFSIDIDAPGDVSVTPRMTLGLSGTGTAYDQEHEISSVQHRINVDEGYRISISAKSKSKKRGKS